MPTTRNGSRGSTSRRVIWPRFHQAITSSTAGNVTTAVLLNIVRVALTGILAHFVDPVTATGFFHTFAGMLVFIVGLFILGFLGRLLERQPGDNKQ